MVSVNMSLIDHTSEITIVMLHREWGAGCHHAECGAHTAVTVEGQGVGLHGDRSTDGVVYMP